MLNEIIEGISRKINEVFGDEYTIYTEEVTQNLEYPCFVILCVSPASIKHPHGRYLRNNIFSATYIPKNDEKANAECLSIQDDLFFALEQITVSDNLVRGTGIKGQIVDGALVCTVNYDIFVRTINEMESMETMELENTVKE